MASEKSTKVKKYLDSHPEFLGEYLQRRMQTAVTSYLENNPTFLNEFLSHRYENENANNTTKADELPRIPKPRRLTQVTSKNNQTPKVIPRPSLRSVESHEQARPQYKNEAIDPPTTNCEEETKQPLQARLLTRVSNFSLHGQENKLKYLKHLEKCREGEEHILLELTKELITTEDPDQFCFLALRYVSGLIDAEKCSLFWMRDSAKGDSKELASRLWNITPTATFDAAICNAKNEMVVSIDVGIVGLVARTKEPEIVANVYEHPSFDKSIDDKTGFESRDIMCYPLILAKEDKVVGVVEVLNKKSREPFSKKDIEILENFIILCCLAIQKSRDSNQIKRLEQAAALQEDLSSKVANLWPNRSYDEVLKGIVMQISELIQCERYTLAVALVDNCNIEGCLQFARSYDMLLQKPKNSGFAFESEEVIKTVDVNKLKKNDWIFSHKVIKKVLETKQSLNMAKITPFSEFKLEDAKKEFSLKTVLCVPYYDGSDRLLGVLHLANKKKRFDEDDEATVKSVRPYVMNGLLFANGFNSIVINKAKTDVADDIVRFHTRAFEEEVKAVVEEEIPEGETYNLYQFTFSDLKMTNDETVLAAMRMFEDLDAFNLYKIKKETMLRWIISVRRCYRPVSYHNWRHGFNVAHTMFLLIDRLNKATMTPGISKTFSDREKFTLVVAGFCHDIDHRGTNNAFLIRAGAPLAILYNTSTLENHHYDTCLRISSMEGNDIFESFTKEDFEASCELMKHAILATDLALYFQRRNTFKALLEKPAEERDFSGNNRMLLMAMMMTASDLSSITKPWEVQQLMAKLVTSEFYDQGDQERELFGTEPMPMMDRSKQGDLPKMQIGFIDGVCSMAYNMMADFCPEFTPLRDGMMENRQRWKERAIEQGMPDPDAPKEKKDEGKEEYGDLWVKYWNMDPENFIWGIDPNEKPPEVVIERVVFSPKKKVGSKPSPNGSTLSEAGDGKSKKRRRNKVANEENNDNQKSKQKSTTCIIA